MRALSPIQLISIDKLFGLFYQITILSFWKTISNNKPDSDRIVAIKLMGKGSLIRLASLCNISGVDINKLTLVTFATQKDVCEWLGIVNVHYLDSRNIFYLIRDCLRCFRTVRKLKPHTVVNLERGAFSVGILGISLAYYAKSQYIGFAKSEKSKEGFKICNMEQLSLNKLFDYCVHLLPKGNRRIERKSVSVDTGKILVNINASDLLKSRRYPIDKFAKIIREINQKKPGIRFFLTGSQDEFSYVETLRKELSDLPVVNKAGTWNFQALSEELESSAILITVDSMPAHMAAYLNTPAITIWGPTQAAHFGYENQPYFFSASLNLSCSPCFKHPASKVAYHCHGRIDCMINLSTDQIVDICIEYLEKMPKNRFATPPSKY